MKKDRSKNLFLSNRKNMLKETQLVKFTNLKAPKSDKHLVFTVPGLHHLETFLHSKTKLFKF